MNSPFIFLKNNLKSKSSLINLLRKHIPLNDERLKLIKEKNQINKNLIRKTEIKIASNGLIDETSNNNGKYNMDLRNIANEILSRQGISDVTISSECTFDNRCFFSYRRDKTSGRFISLIWFNNS